MFYSRGFAALFLVAIYVFFVKDLGIIHQRSRFVRIFFLLIVCALIAKLAQSIIAS
jgi:hypothetical protein